MKKLKICPTRKKDSLFFLVGKIGLHICFVAIAIIIFCAGVDTSKYIALGGIYLAIFLCLAYGTRPMYSRNELVTSVFLSKRKISAHNSYMSFTTIKTENVDKILVWETWIYHNRDDYRNPPKGARPKYAIVNACSKNNFELRKMFVVIPKGYNFDMDLRSTPSGTTRLVDENYTKFKKVANDKNTILLDGTEENYEFLRQVFSYDKFVGVMKGDTKILKQLEENLKE